MGNLGPGELLVILAIALLLFGPKKLPEIGKGIGNALREFNRAKNEFMDSINSEAHRDDSEYSGAYSSSTSALDSPSDTYEYGGGSSEPARDHSPAPEAHAE